MSLFSISTSIFSRLVVNFYVIPFVSAISLNLFFNR